MNKGSKCSIEKHIWTYRKKQFTKSTIFHANGHIEKNNLLSPQFFMQMDIWKISL